MRVITVVNNKGGVAKTITSVNLAYALSAQGYKTLVADLDQQANATLNLGCTGEGRRNIANVFFDGMTFNNAYQETEYDNLYLVPSGSAFINGEQRLIGDVMHGSVERRLKVAMKDLDFDYVIIDCPPSLSTLITNALYISTDVIIPCAIDGFSIEGLNVIYNKIVTAKEDYAEQIQRVGVLWTRIDDVAVKTNYNNLYLIPSSNAFVSALSKLTAEMIPDKDNILNRAIKSGQTKYDFIIIDCPPALDLIITNAIMPATNVVVATSPRKFSTDGIRGILGFIHNYMPYMQDFKELGILITMHEKRRNVIDGVVNLIKNQKQLNVFDTLIPKATVIEQSAFAGEPINYYQPTSQGAIAYGEFVDELLEKCVD